MTDFRYQIRRGLDLYNMLLAKAYKTVSGHTVNFISDFFKSGYKKKALVSYVIEPFAYPLRGNRFYMHTSLSESLAIARVFHELGYRVDIVQYDDLNAQVPDYGYDVLFGHQPNLSRFKKRGPRAIRIMYATGAELIMHRKCRPAFEKSFNGFMAGQG